jgi:hypothetical protein
LGFSNFLKKCTVASAIFCNSVPSTPLIFVTVYLRHRSRRYFRPAAARGTDSDPKLKKNIPLLVNNNAAAGGPHHSPDPRLKHKGGTGTDMFNKVQ